MLFESSSQGNDFRPSEKSVVITNMDKLRKKMSSLVKKTMGNVEEGLRGIEDTQDTIKLRKEVANNLDNIDKSYSKSVLETSRLMDKYAKHIDSQKIKVEDVLGKNNNRDDDRKLQILNGMKEDTATFQRLGNTRYKVFLFLAIISVIVVYTYDTIRMTPYFFLAIFLAILFVFIITKFYTDLFVLFI